MARYLWWIPGILVLCAACGSESRQPVKLTIFGLGLEAGRQLRTDAIEEFTRKTGIEVDVIPTLGASSEQLRLVRKLLQRGEAAPDAYVMDVVWPAVLHEHLLDLSPYISEDIRGHLPVLLENNNVEERLTGLPFYMNAGMLLYRADLLKKYGYDEPPDTWSELTRMALRIQQGERRDGRKEFWGYIWQGGRYEGLTCNALEWQKSFGGGRIIESDGTVSVNNANAVQALETAAGWIGAISPPGILSYTESDTLNVFQSGNAAFMRHWSSAFQSISRTTPSGTAAIALLPAGPAGRGQTIGGFHLGVSRYSRHAKEAASLALFLTGAEVQQRRALRRGYLPTRPRLYERPELLERLPALPVLATADIESWVMRPSTVSRGKYADVSKMYYETVHRILARKARAATALADLEHGLIRLVGSGGKHSE